MLLLDGTVLNVAQRSIRDDFDTDLTAVQWVIDIYLIAFTVPLLLFGWAGDRFGQRRVFAFGTALFVSSSSSPSAPALARTSSGVCSLVPQNGQKKSGWSTRPGSSSWKPPPTR
ncbi:MAG TPA: MFS transporter [Cellvibrionaceae bacterium]|nr:MFS transporter [Cellvibrionaceae bacterium]